MSPGQFVELLKRFTYRPGWKFCVRSVGVTVTMNLLEVRYEAIDATNLSVHRIPLKTQTVMPPFRDEGHAIDWLRDQMTIIENHERDEFFKIDGKQPFNPHANELPYA